MGKINNTGSANKDYILNNCYLFLIIILLLFYITHKSYFDMLQLHPPNQSLSKFVTPFRSNYIRHHKST